jgi:hypothetical protein
MAEHAREPLETAAPAVPEAAGPAPAPLTSGLSPARVLALQRTAGNRATAAILARNGPDGGTATVDAGTSGGGGVEDILSLIGERRWDDAVRRLQGLPAAEMVNQLHRMRRVDLETLRDRAGAMGAEFAGVHDAAEAARVRQLGLDWDAAVAGASWQEAVTLVQAYNDIDLPLKLDALTYEQIDALCRQADRMLPAYARTRQAAEPIRVRKLTAEYDAAVGGADWTRAVTLLNAFNDDDIRRKVDALRPEQRRQMEAAVRQTPAIGTGDRLLTALRARTGTRTGEIFGTVTTTGAPQSATTPGGAYAFVFNLTFTPDPTVVNATQIAFVQTCRLVTPGTNTNREYMEPQNSRRNSRQEAIDRQAGNAFGWYGFGNNGQPNPALSNITPGSAPTPLTPAWLYDRPSDNMTNVSFEFETSVIARQGAQANLVYSVVHWGFTVDNAGAVTANPVRVEDRPTAGFGEAAAAWNAQAAGPVAGRNAPGQQPLPAFR